MIIALNGKPNSGKNTVAKIIQYLCDEATTVNSEQYPLSFKEYCDKETTFNSNYWKIVQFQDSVKDILCIIIGCNIEQLNDKEFLSNHLPDEWKQDKDSSKAVTYEYMLYKLSTLFYDKLQQNTLINALFNKYTCKLVDENGFINVEYNDGRKLSYIPTPIMNPYLFPNWIITDLKRINEAKAIKARCGITIQIIRNIYPNDSINIDSNNSDKLLDNYKFDYVIDNNGTIEELINKVKEILIKERIICD
jgi:hypothetical protein